MTQETQQQEQAKIATAEGDLIAHAPAIAELLLAGLTPAAQPVAAFTGGPIASGKTYASLQVLAPAMAKHYQLHPRNMDRFFETLGQLVAAGRLFEEYTAADSVVPLTGNAKADGEAVWNDLRSHHPSLTNSIEKCSQGVLYINGEMLGLFAKDARAEQHLQQENFRIHHYYHGALRAMPTLVEACTRERPSAMIIDTTMSNGAAMERTAEILADQDYTLNYHLYVSADRDAAHAAMKTRGMLIQDNNFHASHDGFRDARCGKIYEIFKKHGDGLVISALDYNHQATAGPAHLPLLVEGTVPEYAKDRRMQQSFYAEPTLVGDQKLWKSLGLGKMPEPKSVASTIGTRGA